MATTAAAVFQRFLEDVRTVWAAEFDMGRRMERTKPLLERLVLDPSLLADSKGWPSTEGHKNLLLHTDAEYRIRGQCGRAYTEPQRQRARSRPGLGALRAARRNQSLGRYDRLDDGSKPGYAEVKLSGVTNGGAGKVDLVPPYAIHAEQGGTARSVAVIVRSERLVGRVLQNGYDPPANTVVQRSGPTQVPFEVGCGVAA